MLAREAAGPLGAVALAAQLTYISFDGEETPTRGYAPPKVASCVGGGDRLRRGFAPSCWRQESRPS